MPKLIARNPKYRLHRASGQALVTLDGRDFYLGAQGTAASRQDYDRLIGEWLAAGRRLPRRGPGGGTGGWAYAERTRIEERAPAKSYQPD